jgi:putative ABC transport system ATP-binding protein
MSRQTTGALLRRALNKAPALGAGLTLTLALAMLGQAITVVVPVVLQTVIDNDILGESGPSIGNVVWKSAGAIVLLALGVVIGRAAVLRLVKSSSTGLSDLRSMTFRHLLRRAVLHVQSSRRGVLVARVTSDVETIQEFMEWGGIGLVVSTSQVLMAVVAMALYEWRLAAVAVIAIAVYFTLMRLFQRLLRKRYDEVRAEVGRSLGVLSEAISGIPVVRAYGIEDTTRGKVGDALNERFRKEFRAGRFGATLFSSAEIFSGILTCLMIIGAVLIGTDGGMTAGRLVAFLFLINLVVEPLQMLVQTLDQAQSAGSGLRRILGILDSDIEVTDPEDARPLRPGGLSVRFDNVSYAYPDGPMVLQNITADIPVGSRVAVVGETGSVKTTFAKLLVRLLDPAEGSIHLGGEPLTGIKLAELRQRVAFIPQEGFLFDASLADNVRYGRPGASEAEIWAAFHELGLEAWVDSLRGGLQAQAGERGHNLSAGERQLVALVRAWISSPDLLVLDEATSAVDPALDVHLRHAIERLSEGRTTITIAHRLSTAQRADDVLVFDRGRLVERGPHRELVRAGGFYAAMYQDWTAGTRSQG